MSERREWPNPAPFVEFSITGFLIVDFFDRATVTQTPANNQKKTPATLPAPISYFNVERVTNYTFSQDLDLALLRTASQTRCVSSASRNVGAQGSPVSKLFKKSAT